MWLIFLKRAFPVYNLEQDTYKTITIASEEVLYKEKGSKFFGYAFPVNSEDEVRLHLDALKKKHPLARHFCYAWQLGTETLRYRANDDGEPSNTAGMPIYGQIQSFGINNVLVVVVRYFGGTKLGAGGLIAAYRSTAHMALQEVEIVEKTIDIIFVLNFSYEEMNKVMRVIKEKNLTILSQKMEERCEIELTVRKNAGKEVSEILSSMHKIMVKFKD